MSRLYNNQQCSRVVQWDDKHPHWSAGVYCILEVFAGCLIQAGVLNIPILGCSFLWNYIHPVFTDVRFVCSKQKHGYHANYENIIPAAKTYFLKQKETRFFFWDDLVGFRVHGWPVPNDKSEQWFASVFSTDWVSIRLCLFAVFRPVSSLFINRFVCLFDFFCFLILSLLFVCLFVFVNNRFIYNLLSGWIKL